MSTGTPWIYQHLSYAHSMWLNPSKVRERAARKLHDSLPHDVEKHLTTHDHK